MKTLKDFVNESIICERFASPKLVDKGNLYFTYERDPEDHRYSKRLCVLGLDPSITVEDLKKLTVELPDVKPSWGESGFIGKAAEAYIIDIELQNTKAAKEIEKNRSEDMTDYLNDVFRSLPTDCMVSITVSRMKHYWRNLQGKWSVLRGGHR
jgi:hypothetical protein